MKTIIRFFIFQGSFFTRAQFQSEVYGSLAEVTLKDCNIYKDQTCA